MKNSIEKLLNCNQGEIKKLLLDVDKLSEIREISNLELTVTNTNVSVSDLEVLLSKSEVVIIDEFNGEKVYSIKLCCTLSQNKIEVYGIIFDNPSTKLYDYVYTKEYRDVRSKVHHIEHDDDMETETWFFE